MRVGRLAHEVRRYYPADQDRRAWRTTPERSVSCRELNEHLSAVYLLVRPSTGQAVRDCHLRGYRKRATAAKKTARNLAGDPGNIGLGDYATPENPCGLISLWCVSSLREASMDERPRCRSRKCGA